MNSCNPDGRCGAPDRLGEIARKTGRLVVGESFADATPGPSLAPGPATAGLLVLHSFGEFRGLAGVDLGVVLGAEADIDTLAAMAGPWAVSGVAIAIGTTALA